MEDYSAFCDKTMSEKGYAIETAGKAIADLGATIADCKAQVTSLEDDIVTLGSAESCRFRDQEIHGLLAGQGQTQPCATEGSS